MQLHYDVVVRTDCNAKKWKLVEVSNTTIGLYNLEGIKLIVIRCCY